MLNKLLTNNEGGSMSAQERQRVRFLGLKGGGRWLFSTLLAIAGLIMFAAPEMAVAQTPTHAKNLGTTSGSTNLISSTVAKKTQLLYTPTDLGTTAVTGGNNITSIFLKNTVAGETGTF